MSPYLDHLLGWFVPVILLQWIIGWRIFVANRVALIAPTMLAGTYYSFSDWHAIHQGIWMFGDGMICGVHVGPIPLEEILFFFLTALLVAQSFLLFLPAGLRHGGNFNRPPRP